MQVNNLIEFTISRNGASRKYRLFLKKVSLNSWTTDVEWAIQHVRDDSIFAKWRIKSSLRGLLGKVINLT